MNSADPTDVHPLVAAFRQDLRRAVGTLPPDRQQRVLDDIDAHLAETLGPGATEAEVRQALDRLGSPAAIAAEAGATPMPPSPAQVREIAALAFLSVGGLVFWFVGWAVGVWLLWTSNRWTTRDKVIGTIGTLFNAFPPLTFILLGRVGRLSSVFIGPVLALVTVIYLGVRLSRTR